MAATQTEVKHPEGYGATFEAIEALNCETPEEEIRVRQALGRGGRPVMRDGDPLMLSYVTARYVEDTLDNTVGPANWQDAYEVLPGGAVKCGIGILVLDNDLRPTWIWKFDVGVRSMIEPDKGAFSDAFKRAGVKWGIARDLYDERDEQVEPEPESVPNVAPRPPIRDQVSDGYGGGYGDEAPARPPRPQRGGYNRRPRYGGGNVSPMRGRPDREAAPQEPIDPGEAPWICPVHNDVKMVPAGVSTRTGNPYGAFWACPVSGCDERGPWVNG